MTVPRWVTTIVLIVLVLALASSRRSGAEDEPVRPAAAASLLHDICADVPDRPPTVLAAGWLKHLPDTASRVPHTFHLCESRSIHCHAIVNLTSPFTEQRPAPAALGLTPRDSKRLRRQFWWQTRPELAPRPFGWILPKGGGGGGRRGSLDRAELTRVRSLAGLYHRYAVGVGRAAAPGGGFVELCKRCPHEGALYVPPSGGAPGVNALVEWAARVISEPKGRLARRAKARYCARVVPNLNPVPNPNPNPNLTLTRYYERAVAKPVQSYARLLVLTQRFSADCDWPPLEPGWDRICLLLCLPLRLGLPLSLPLPLLLHLPLHRSANRLISCSPRALSDGHFFTELLPRAVAAAPLLAADGAMKVMVDCSAGFVAPWLGFLLGIGPERLVCSEGGDRLVHAECLAFSRFASPFPSGFRLGLDNVRTAAHAQLHNSPGAGAGAAALAGAARQGERPLVVWADRDLGRFTAHGVRCVHGAEKLLVEQPVTRRWPWAPSSSDDTARPSSG